MQAITPESGEPRAARTFRLGHPLGPLAQPRVLSSASDVRQRRYREMASALTKLGLTTEDLSHRRVTAVLTFLRDAGLRGG